MDHVLRTLKKHHPVISNVYFRQDNAGCYHSALVILSADILPTRSGIRIAQIDFSDPQGGKGACDRKAAQIKAHVKSYISEGNSVKKADELKKAIESRGGIPGVIVAAVKVDAKASTSTEEYKLDGISSLNNFKYGETGFTAFRAFNIGKGKFFSLKLSNQVMVQ